MRTSCYSKYPAGRSSIKAIGMDIIVRCLLYTLLLLHEIHLYLNRERVPVDEPLPDNLLNTCVLDESEAPWTDPLLWPVERQNLRLGHDRVALTFTQTPWMD